MTNVPKQMFPHDMADLPIAAEIESGPDRVCAILGLAYLEEKLTGAIKSQLVRDKATAKKLLRANGPIGNFAAKTDIGYMLGLYSAAVRDEFLILAEIRNAFAHWTKLIDFETREIRKKCESLDGFRNAFTMDEDFFPKPFNHETSRGRWLFAISFFSQHLEIISRSHRDIGEPQL